MSSSTFTVTTNAWTQLLDTMEHLRKSQRANNRRVKGLEGQVKTLERQNAAMRAKLESLQVHTMEHDQAIQELEHLQENDRASINAMEADVEDLEHTAERLADKLNDHTDELKDQAEVSKEFKHDIHYNTQWLENLQHDFENRSKATTTASKEVITVPDSDEESDDSDSDSEGPEEPFTRTEVARNVRKQNSSKVAVPASTDALCPSACPIDFSKTLAAYKADNKRIIARLAPSVDDLFKGDKPPQSDSDSSEESEDQQPQRKRRKRSGLSDKRARRTLTGFTTAM